MLCEHERELVPPLPPSFLPELGDKRIRFPTPPLFPATVVVVVEATGLENMGNSAGFFPRGKDREGRRRMRIWDTKEKQTKKDSTVSFFDTSKIFTELKRRKSMLEQKKFLYF